MGETAALAEFVTGLGFADLPGPVVDKVGELLLDQFAAQIASSVKPWSKGVYRHARAMGGTPEASVVNYGDRLPVEMAAYVNASFGRGFEIDDTHRPSLSHPATVVIPAALALGERELVDGNGLITAIVAGYEAMGRVGRSIAPSSVERGFDPTSAAGPFGAAAVAGKMLRLSPELVTSAFGIAASSGAGLMEFARVGGNTVSLHPANATQGGLRAAFLAREGVIGPATALEGANGFARAFSNGARLEDITKGFGESWRVMEIVYKRYHTDYFLQAPIDAALKIVRANRFSPDEVEEVVVGSNRHAPHIVGAITAPTDVSASHFSAAFCLGMCLVRGSNSFDDYSEESLADPAIRAMAARVRVEVDPEIDALYPAKRAGKVTIRLKGGRVLQEKVLDAKGTLENPMTRAEVEDKFRALAGVVMDEARIEALIGTIRDLPALRDTAQLARLLVR